MVLYSLEVHPNARLLLDECIEDLLEQINKSGCEKSAQIIRCYLEGGFYKQDEDNIVEVFDMAGEAEKAIQALARKNKLPSAKQKLLSQKMTLLKDSLNASREELHDKSIQKLLVETYENESDSSNLSEDICALERLLRYTRKNFYKRPSRGEAGISELKNFAYSMALIYEKLSSKKFTSLSNKDGEKRVPISDGQIFFTRVVTLINDIAQLVDIPHQYNSRNVDTACNFAVKKISSSKKLSSSSF